MNRRLALCFALALLLRLGWVASLDERLTWSDEEEFARIARHLAAGDGFASDSYRANPILPAYLSGMFQVFGETYLPARIGQAVCGALTVVLVAASAARLLGDGVGTLAGLVLAVYLPHIYLAGVFYVDCLFTFLAASCVYLSLRSLEERAAVGWSVAAGVAFGLTTLTRSIFVVYLPFLLAALWYGARRRDGRRLVACGALAVAAVLTILPWTVRNYRTFGHVIPVSSGFGTKLWQGNNEMASGGPSDRELFWNNDFGARGLALLDASERQAVEERYAEVERRIAEEQVRTGDRYLASDAVLTPIALEYMWRHPVRTVGLFFTKLGTLFSPFSETLTTNADVNARNRLLVGLQYLPVLCLAFLGGWLGRREGPGLWVIYSLIGSLAAAYSILNTCTRFRLPLDPWLIVFASLAAVRCWSRARGWLGRPAIARMPL